ncbi:MAG: NPCBM/NEW2 domain-containing protein [Thermoguttaceae bacterium]|nr:NPCBM/NEW2 domain-containing protein [Thermoguttaceae bacterium]MDW8039760.1 NPCBM/NEW2 domain-containing protein [Thermoguttaceae bacterium]
MEQRSQLGRARGGVQGTGGLVKLLSLFGAALLALAGPGEAATVVLANRASQPVQLAVRLSSGHTGQATLPPGRLMVLPVGEAAELTYTIAPSTTNRSQTSHSPASSLPPNPLAGSPQRIMLRLNTLYYFLDQGQQVVCRPVIFSQDGAVGWIHADPSGQLPPVVNVPVKLLADEEHPAKAEVWQEEFKRLLRSVSEIFQQYCRVRFEVVAAEGWQSDNALGQQFDRLFEEFRRKVSPEPGRLAVGFTSQWKLGHPNHVPAPYIPPLSTHLLLPAPQKNLSDQELFLLLLHQLGHWLGAVETPEAGSIMHQNFYADREKAFKEGLRFDPVNTLAMNLLAEELRRRNIGTLAEIPRSTRRYLQAIYLSLNPHHLSEPFQVAQLVADPPSSTGRYLGRWTDGSEAAADAVENWHDLRAQPRLAGRMMFDTQPEIRWLMHTRHALPEVPEAAVEFFAGDLLPGRVVGLPPESDGEPSTGQWLHVVPAIPVDWPEAAATNPLLISTRWIRRIWWQRPQPTYEPATVFDRQGRRVRFRSLRFGQEAVRVLTSDGIQQFPYEALAELHLPAQDPWEAWLEQLAMLAPDGKTRLVQLETRQALRATASWQRMQIYHRGNPGDANGWYQMIQPVWAARPIWVPFREVRLWCFFRPVEVPLSRIPPASYRQSSPVSGPWPLGVDRNVEGGPLTCAGREFAWGFGLHATAQLEFLLPPFAKAFSSRLGLDHLAGEGGCVAAMVYGASSQSPPLYKSPLIIGAADVFDTGRLELSPASAGSRSAHRLLLHVEATPAQTPRGADPWDIRDHFNWLEPMVELDAEKLPTELLRRMGRLVPAWEGWLVQMEEPWRRPLLMNVLNTLWQEHRPMHQRKYILAVTASESAVRLSRRLFIPPEKDLLCLGVWRLESVPPSRVELWVDGQSAGAFEVPIRREPRTPLRSLSLAEHRGKEILVELVQRASDERAWVVWETLQLAPSGQLETERIKPIQK